MSLFRRFVFIGAPGVGKGTFAKILCRRENLAHISIGDKLRDEVNKGSDLGKQVAAIMDRGDLVSDSIVNAVLQKNLVAARETSAGFLLDGYPRTAEQATHLEQVLNDISLPTDSPVTAVHIALDRQVTIDKLMGRRLCSTCGGSFNTAHIVGDGFDMPAILPNVEECTSKRGTPCTAPDSLERRDDDTPAAIAARLAHFDQTVEPLVKFYSGRNQLVTFTVRRGIKDTDALWKEMTSHPVKP